MDGMVFTRESTRDREDAVRSQALNLLRKELLAENVLAAREEYKGELGFSVSRTRPKDESRAVGLTPAFPPETNVYGAMGGYDFQKELIDQIFSGNIIGRALLRVTKDLDKFKGSPSDIPLEDGDIIFIPKEPRHILVMGEVYNQASILYQEGKSLAYYLSQAGGPTKRADKDSTFVIRPYGSVVSKAAIKQNKGVEVWDAETGKWEKIKDFKKMALKPGDAIIVPMEFEEEKKLSKQVKNLKLDHQLYLNNTKLYNPNHLNQLTKLLDELNQPKKQDFGPRTSDLEPQTSGIGLQTSDFGPKTFTIKFLDDDGNFQLTDSDGKILPSPHPLPP